MGVTDVGAFVRGHLRGSTPELGVTATVLDADHAALDVYVRSPASGGGAVTIADGADVTLGAVADVAVTGDAPGSVNAHLRGITKQLAGTIAVSLATNTPDVTDRAGRLLGQVTNAGTFAVQATLAAETTKVIGTVNIAAAQTIAVTNAGTFVVQATLAAETTKVIGTVNQGTSPWVIGHSAFPSSQGQKTMGTSFGVVIAADQSSFPVAATLTAETTKVIGTVNISSGQTVGLATGSNVIGSISNTSFAATQATASALNATVVGTGTFVVQATLAAETTKVIGTVNIAAGQSITANAGTNLNTSALALDATLTNGTQRIEAGGATGAAVPARALQIGGTDGTLLRAISVDTAGRPNVNATLGAETTKVIGTVRTADTLGNSLNSCGPGFLRTTDEPHQLFYDPFDGVVIDVVNRWSVAYGAGAVAPSQTGGQAVITTPATSGAWCSLQSRTPITPTVPSWLGTSAVLNFTDGAAFVATGYRFFGVGSVPSTPTVAAPITDGVGFEVTGGKMYAVVYASGVRTVIQDMSAATGNATAPTDIANHRYIVQVRTDKAYWYVDTTTTPVATSNFQSPTIQTLPVQYLAVSGGSATAIQSPGVAVWDTGKNSFQISDGTNPFRKATVTAAGALTVAQTAPPPNSSLEVGGQLQIQAELLQQLLIELRIHSLILGQGLNVVDDPAGLRNDPAYS